MLVILKRDNEEVNEQAAQFIAGAIRKKPSLTLGLATGNTMVGLYQHLARLHRAGSLDFSQVTTFNLDEYLGLPASHPQSFHRFMRENFFRHVNVPRNPRRLRCLLRDLRAGNSRRRRNRLAASRHWP